MNAAIITHFKHFEPVIARIIAANPCPVSLWQHSAGKAAGDIVQDAAEDLRFGDDPIEVRHATIRKLSAFKGA